MFSDPQKNVLEFGFLPGQKVVDLGSGAGHYANALSQILGAEGRVYAVDLDKDMLTKLKNESEKAGRGNIEVIWGDIEKPHGTRLKDSAADGAVFSNILFQLADRKGAIIEAKRILRPGGKICVVEWADLQFLASSAQNRAPVTDSEAKAIFESEGLAFERAFDAGEHHYGAMFVKPVQ